MGLDKIAPLFEGWEEAMIWACLQGCMGYAMADDDVCPASAQIVVGDFCFFAGVPSEALARKAAAPIMALQSEGWERAIASAWKGARKATRYATRKDKNAFDTAKLGEYACSLGSEYALVPIDSRIYGQLMSQKWSRDLCALFDDAGDYAARGVGVAVLLGGQPVSGASSYAVYRGGIEIEIDTHPDFRGRGLATACGAALILECMKRGLYPSWDAHDLRSCALAQKLGYIPGNPYVVYLNGFDD